MTISCQKHNLCSPNVPLRAVAVSDIKLVAVGGAQLNVGSLVHSSDPHTRVHQRIRTRIEMYGFGPLGFLPLTLSQPYAGAATVLVNELDPDSI
jgi:hypothetical protein